MDRAAGFVLAHLGEARTGFHEDVHYGEVGLQGFGVQSGYLGLAEYGSRYQEVGRGAPIPFDIHVGSRVFLPAFYVEHDFRAVVPVLRFGEVLPAFHVTPDFHAESFEHIHRYEKIWDAFRLGKPHDRVFFQQRQCHEQSGDDLRTS